MSIEQNKAVVRRYFDELFTAGRLDRAAEIVAEGYIDHTARPGRPAGVEGVKEVIGTFRTAFPDLRVQIAELLGEGELVATRFVITGTHNGPLMGVPPTGRTVRVPGMCISRIAGGTIAEQWDQADMLGLLQQLGVVPGEGG